MRYLIFCNVRNCISSRELSKTFSKNYDISYGSSVPGMETTGDTLSSIAEISKPVTAGILELTSKLKESAIVPAIPFHKINPSSLIQSISVMSTVTIGTDTTTIVNAEEAVEVPPIVPIDLSTPLTTEMNAITEHTIERNEQKDKVNDEKWNDRRHIFQKIGQQEFEDVVFTPERKNKKFISRTINGNDNDSQLSNSDNSSSRLSRTSKVANNNEAKMTHSSLLTLSIDDEFILKPERRSLETIQKDVESKEKLLADVLNFDLSEYMTGSRIYSTNSNTLNSINTITYVNCNINSNDSLNGISLNSMVNGDFEEQNEQSEHTETESIEDEDESYRTELKKLEDLKECSKELLQSKVGRIGTSNSSMGDSGIEGRNSVDLGCEPSLGATDPRELKIQCNVLSKEFVTPASVEEGDWVLL